MNRLFKAAAAVAFLALSLCSSRAQTPVLIPLGFCSLSGMSSATALSACTGSWNAGAGGIPSGSNYAVICAYTQAINYRDDGTAPTGTPGTGGQAIPSGSCIPYSGTLSKVQMIQQTSGAIAGVSFYKNPGNP